MKAKTGPAPKDITGMRFDRLIAREYVGLGKWRCVCDCGNICNAHGSDMRRGKIRSCGCLNQEVAKTGDRRRTHGMAGTPEYRSWTGMINRCTNPSARGYHRYGGRGIEVCERWINSFEAFYEDMGPRPVGTSIDRIDFNGNYEPENCRWADIETQNSNTSTTVLITAKSETKSLGAWARELGVSTVAIRYRLKKGMSHEDAITKPFRKHVRW